MGCWQSGKVLVKPRSADDDNLNEMADTGLPDPVPPAPTDPRLPLDARQVFKLKKSWKGIKRCMEDTGVEMFIRMFKRKEEIKGIFTKFEHLKNDDEMRMDETFEKHATLVMGTLDEIISNIDNVDYIFSIIKTMGERHVRIPNFKQDFIMEIQQPFLEAVKLTLGDRYTDNMDSIYKITIKFILETFVKSYGEAEKAAER